MRTAVLLALTILLGASCTTVRQRVEVRGQYPQRAAANAALLAGDLPRTATHDLSDEDARRFEGNGPAYSERHFRSGTKSLRWAWNQPDSRLVWHVPVPYRPKGRDPGAAFAQVSVFRLWVYNEVAQPSGTLRVSFGNRAKGREDCSFPYGLNFTGWRLIAYKFDQMDGNPQGDTNAVTLTTNLASGILFFDDLTPANREDARWQWPDYQTTALLGKGRVPTALHINSPEMQALRRQPMTADQARDVRMLKQTVLDSLALPAYSPGKAAAAEAFFASYCIVRDGLSIRGKALEIHAIRPFLTGYYSLAVLCRTAPPDQQPRLLETFLDASEFLLDQGVAEGSALNALHHFGYKSRKWAPAMLLMENELRQAGLLDRLTMALIWCGRDFTDFTAPYDRLPRDTKQALAARLADYLNTFANTHLCSLLLLPDSQAKSRCLRQYADLLNHLLLLPNASIKPDGSFYHHHMHYAGYAIPALMSFSGVAATLDGSAFEISPAAYARLRNALWMAYIWGYPGFAFNAFGRHPLGGSALRLRHALKAAARSVPGSDAVDPDLANVLAVMTGEGVARPQGYWSMNYHASGILRHGDYSVVAKGFHDHGVRSHETYGRDNRYGRYGSHGSVTVFREGAPNHSGYQHDGWDWSLVPGATTLRLPFDVLEGGASFYGWRPPQQVPFAGSSHLDHEVGVFAFQVDGTSHEQSLQARKSVFAARGLLVCLGSNIRNTSARYPTVTALVQNGLKGALRHPQVGRTSKSDPADAQGVGLGSPTYSQWTIDVTGVGYRVAPGNSPLKTATNDQASRHNKTKEPTQGRFFTAWLDHGAAPQDAAYEYAMLLDATPERLAADLPYEVLHKTRTCHAVRFPQRRTDAYAFFAEPANSAAQLPAAPTYIAVDAPGLVILKRTDSGVVLSVCDPVPPIKRPFDEPAAPTRFRVQLRDHFGLAHASRPTRILSSSADATVLEVEVCDGFPTRVELNTP